MTSSRCEEELCTTSEQVNICRLCGQCKSDIIAIFSEEAHRKHVLLKIQTRLLIQISALDPLPKNACNDCLEKLDSLWDFFELCRKTQIKLRETFLNQRSGGRNTLREQTIDHQGNIRTSHPPRCSLKSITRQTTQDISDSVSGNKRIKLELVPLIETLKEDRVCLDEKSRAILASTVTSITGSQKLYRNDNGEISAESSENSNICARSDNQQGSDNTVNKLCLSEMAKAIVKKSIRALQHSDIGEVRSSVSLSVQKSSPQNAASSNLKDSSLEQQGRLQIVSKTVPIIDKQASSDCINGSAVQENRSRSSPAISVSHGESHENMLMHRKDSLWASTRTGGCRYSPVRSFVSDSDIQRDVSLIGRENSVVQQMEENISSRSTLSYGKNQEAVQQILANSSVSSSENITLAGILSGNSGANRVQVEGDDNRMLRSLLCIHENSEKEKRDTLEKEDTGTNTTKSVTQEGMKCDILKEKDRCSTSNNTGGLSGNSGASHVQVQEDENNMLRSSLCIHGNSEKEKSDTLEKEDTDTNATKSITQEGTKCDILKERDHISASNNTDSLCETVNSCSKLHDDDDDGGGGGGDDCDGNDCVGSFTCHDSGNSFSCKNSLADHIFKQHMDVGQTNTLHATPPSIIAFKCSDSSINKLSPSDVGSVQSANISGSVLQKLETVSNSVQTGDKQIEDALASNSIVCSVDDNDLVVVYHSTSNNTSCVKPLEAEFTPDVKPLEIELKPTTIEEALLICKKYSQIICETSGENPKLNMINIKVELTSGDLYTNTNYNFRKIFKPFIVLQDSRYDCQICKATLNNRSAIVKHVGKHFNLFPYSCKICNKRYTQLQDANEHIKTHLTELICEQCGAVCCSLMSYIKHMNVHNKPYSCHDCGGRYRSKSALRDHIWKEHMKIRTHVCQICGKAYFHAGNVATHMIFAHADRKIVCQYCGKMYFRNNMLKLHIRRWHT